jgi:hypothetical protein
MFEPLLADGIASGAGEKLATYVVKCLAVGGGFLVGYFLGGAIAWALDRWVFAHKAPAQLKKLVSFGAGLALAIVVALIVFGEGGSGLFGGRGSEGEGKGTTTSDDKGKTTPAETVPPKNETPPKKNEKTKPPELPPTPGDVHVVILSGAEVKEGRFYRIEGESVPKTLTFNEFRDAIIAKRKASKSALILIFRYQGDGLPEDHPEIRRLNAWLDEAKLTRRFE